MGNLVPRHEATGSVAEWVARTLDRHPCAGAASGESCGVVTLTSGRHARPEPEAACFRRLSADRARYEADETHQRLTPAVLHRVTLLPTVLCTLLLEVADSDSSPLTGAASLRPPHLAEQGEYPQSAQCLEAASDHRHASTTRCFG